MASPPRSDFRRIGCRAPPEVAGSTDTSFAIGPVTQSGRAASQTNQSQWRAIMTKTIFVNLPVTDLAAATRFYNAIGCEKNEQFSDHQASSMVWSDAITFQLLANVYFATFTPKTIADAHATERKSTRL